MTDIADEYNAWRITYQVQPSPFQAYQAAAQSRDKHIQELEWSHAEIWALNLSHEAHIKTQQKTISDLQAEHTALAESHERLRVALKAFTEFVERYDGTVDPVVGNAIIFAANDALAKAVK